MVTSTQPRSVLASVWTGNLVGRGRLAFSPDEHPCMDPHGMSNAPRREDPASPCGDASGTVRSSATVAEAFPPSTGAERNVLDLALIARARAGDARAFRALFMDHRSDVVRLVHRTLGPSPEVEDVVQEVFLHVYRSLASFRGEAQFRTWLYRLAINVVRMHLRRARSRPRFAAVDVPEGPRADAPPRDGPDDEVDTQARVRSLYRLLDQLSDKKREILVLHDFEGMPAKEIADLVGVPVLTVRTRLFYARKELYAAMREDPHLACAVASLGGAARATPGLVPLDAEARGSRP